MRGCWYLQVKKDHVREENNVTGSIDWGKSSGSRRLAEDEISSSKDNCTSYCRLDKSIKRTTYRTHTLP